MNLRLKITVICKTGDKRFNSSFIWGYIDTYIKVRIYIWITAIIFCLINQYWLGKLPVLHQLENLVNTGWELTKFVNQLIFEFPFLSSFEQLHKVHNSKTRNNRKTHRHQFPLLPEQHHAAGIHKQVHPIRKNITIYKIC